MVINFHLRPLMKLDQKDNYDQASHLLMIIETVGILYS